MQHAWSGITGGSGGPGQGLAKGLAKASHRPGRLSTGWPLWWRAAALARDNEIGADVCGLEASGRLASTRLARSGDKIALN